MLVDFLLVVHFMMQIKFKFSNFIFYGVPATACQRASGIVGLSNNDVIALRALRLFRQLCYVSYVLYVPCVSFVTSLTFLTLRALRRVETPL